MPFPLNAYASALRVHPRTILRRMVDEENPYWTEDHDPALDLAQVASAFGCDPLIIDRALKKRDVLFTPLEAAEFLKLSPRLFRYHKYTATIRRKGVVRYSRVALVNEHYAVWE